MINQVLCFPDGNSVVPFSQISYLSLSYQLALVLTLPKYLCRTQQRLKTHWGFCSAYIAPDTSHFCWTEVIGSWDSINWLFISFYCIFTCWLESRKKRISLKDGACLPAHARLLCHCNSLVWLDFYGFTMRTGVCLCLGVCVLKIED